MESWVCDQFKRLISIYINSNHIKLVIWSWAGTGIGQAPEVDLSLTLLVHPYIFFFLPASSFPPSSSLPSCPPSLHLSKWNCTPCPCQGHSRWWPCHRKSNFKFKCTLRISILQKNFILKDEQKQQGHFWDRKKRHFANQINKCSCSRLIINLFIWPVISASLQQETHKLEVILLCTVHTMDDFFTQRHFSGDRWD